MTPRRIDLSVHEPIVGVHMVVTNKFVGVSMELFRPRFRDDLDVGAGAHTDVCPVVRRGNAELRDGVKGGKCVRGRPPGTCVVVLGTLDFEVVVIIASPIEGNAGLGVVAQLRRVPRILGGGAGGEDGQHLVIAPHQGQVLNLASADHIGNRGILRFNFDGATLDGDFLVYLPDRHRQVHPQRLTNLQGNSRPHELLKARGLRGDNVITDGNPGGRVFPRRVGH